MIVSLQSANLSLSASAVQGVEHPSFDNDPIADVDASEPNASLQDHLRSNVSGGFEGNKSKWSLSSLEGDNTIGAEDEGNKSKWSLSSLEGDNTIGAEDHNGASRRLNMSKQNVGFLKHVLKYLGISNMSGIWLLVWCSSVCIAFTVLCHMVPQQTLHNNMRLPPRWEPGLENALPFRTWLQDLLLWTITSDLEPHRQPAAIISQLGGAARELARTLTPQEIFNGGVINGQHLDPVSFLIHGLSTRFSPLDDEIRIRAAQDLLQFQRKGNESVDVLITRFETIRSRARAEGGGANVSTESASLILLRAIGVSSEQFQRLTQPFGLRLPNNEAELAQLMHQLRRMGHIIEHHPSNIADSLHRNVGASNSGQAFVVHSADGSADPSQTSWSYVGQSVHPPSNDT